jgi:prepilin-type N-terminal cleavage/methylation domain-containing protein
VRERGTAYRAATGSFAGTARESADMITLKTHRTNDAAVVAPAVVRRERRGGFTLIEILTVLIILGIASAIIAPQIGSRGDLKVRAAARVCVADLMYAQNMAIANQKWMYVKFDAAGETYQVMDAAGPSGGDSIIMHPVTKEPFISKFGPGSNLADVMINTAVFNGIDTTYRPEFTIAFDELGTPYVYDYSQNNTNEMLDGTVEFKSGAFTIKVVVERYTGEIKVQ